MFIDIDVNIILNQRTSYLRHKCCKKAIDCCRTCILIIHFHEIAISYESQLKTQLIFWVSSANHNVGLQSYLHFKICQMIYLLSIYQVMEDFQIYNWLLNYDSSKISAILAILSNITLFLQNFLKYCWIIK